MPPVAWRRPLLLALAVLYTALTIVYSVVWMRGARMVSRSFLGIASEYDSSTAALVVQRVVPGSGAERAGLRVHDRLVAIDGQGLESRRPLDEALQERRPGEPIRLSVLREGAARPLEFTAVLGRAEDHERAPLTRRIAGEILASYPVLFLAVAVPLLFLRVHDPHAWRIALLFAGFIAGAPYSVLRAPEALRGLTMAYKVFFYGAMPGLFLYVFSVFPEPSPLHRRLPSLKTLWLTAAVAGAGPLALWGLFAGGSWPLEEFGRRLPRQTSVVGYVYTIGGFVLGAVSLASNALRGSESARRKSRVIVWGIIGGILPLFAVEMVADLMDRAFYQFSFWVWAPCVMALFLVPLSFAYAVVKHRVLEVPVLLRRSARYLLVQRGAVGLLVLIGAGSTLAFADSMAGYLQPRMQAALPTAAVGGAAFGTLLIWTGTRLHRRLRERIDRAFFRAAYDARSVLQDLAERARRATSREDLAALIDHHLRGALLPRSLSIYLEGPHGGFARSGADDGDGDLRIGPEQPLMIELARRGEPTDVTPDRADRPPLPPALEGTECLVPVLGRDGRLSGLIALGPRLSEEPYSREDKRLLASVAGQAGIALDSVHLGEQVAERLEVERRAAHEMELAQRVQRRLLPQEQPLLATLEYAGRCLQARAVGGDYYDFLDLAPGRLGLVLADVSGKGFPAALLMASLQASLRSRTAEDMMDLPRQLRAVNHLLYRSSEISRYATLFIGIYDDATRRLVYADCGHNPPLLLRANGGLERLQPTAPVLGLLEEWECTVAETRLGPGDLLVLFTDGVSEALSDEGEEFGEERLEATVRASPDAPLERLLDVVVEEVARFSGSEQEDDLTLVLARGR